MPNLKNSPSDEQQTNPSAFTKFLKDHKSALWMAIIIITLLWGYAWVLMKEAIAYMGPSTFSAFRFGTGAVAMLFVVLALKIGLPPKHAWKHLIVVGILQTSIVFLLVMYGLKFVDAGKSSVLLYSMPMFSSLLAARFLSEKLTLTRTIGLATGMIGLLTILGWDIWTKQNSDIIIGELLIIVAAVSWGVSNVYYRKKLQHISQLQVNTWQMVFGTIGILIVSLPTEWGDPIVLNGSSIYYILYTGVLASALCYTGWFLILSLVDMVTATISTLLVPIFGLTFSSLILSEQMSLGVLVGSGLIILGIIIAQVAMKTKKDRKMSVDQRESVQ